MRIVVDARRPIRARLALAALALPGRGHDVTWLGPPRGADSHAPTEGLDHATGLAALARGRVDAVVADGRSPFPAAAGAWILRARALLLAFDPDEAGAWSALDRWGWDGSHGFGLIESDRAERARNGSSGLDLARLGLWSDEAPPAAPDAGHPDAEILERGLERALARRRARARRPAVFLDRDGTLVVERGYLADPADLELLPGALPALRQLAAAGHALVVISNQSGVGRGFFPLSTVHAAMGRLRRMLAREGVELDAIYFCPHRPEAGCDCRKPGIALLERAVEDLRLDPALSAMVGDKLLDVETGQRAGARGILLRTGYGKEEEQRLGGDETAPKPDAVCDDLPSAAAWILEGHPAGRARL